MNKTELCEAASDALAKKGQGHLGKTAVECALNACLGVLQDEMARGGRVQIKGLGVFSVAATKARPGRNPRTGEIIMIQAGRRVSFKVGKTLREAVNG